MPNDEYYKRIAGFASELLYRAFLYGGILSLFFGGIILSLSLYNTYRGK